MRRFTLPVLAAAALLAAPALAAPPLAGGPAFPPFPAPPTGAEADVTNPGYVYVQPDGAGPYDCQLGERRTRLEKQACGPLKNRYGD